MRKAGEGPWRRQRGQGQSASDRAVPERFWIFLRRHRLHGVRSQSIGSPQLPGDSVSDDEVPTQMDAIASAFSALRFSSAHFDPGEERVAERAVAMELSGFGLRA